MARIYFDKQIFSKLFKPNDSRIEEFLNQVLANRSQFLFCYSHAHLLDLKNDKSDFKYLELDFMEKIVQDNYLSYHFLKKTTSCYLVNPKEAFNSLEVEEEFTFETIFNDLLHEDSTPEEIENVNKLKELGEQEFLNLNRLNLEELSGDNKKLFEYFFDSGSNSISLSNLFDKIEGFSKILSTEREVYKTLRNVSVQSTNAKNIKCSTTQNFNIAENYSQFIDSVLKAINPNGDKQIPFHELFCAAYLFLDLYGIQKEPSKKVKFSSLKTDSYHSYYGAYCDFVVSEDKGFVDKTKLLYDIFGIKTKVLYLEEFIDYFNEIIEMVEKEQSDFMNKLTLTMNLINSSALDIIQKGENNFRVKSPIEFLGVFNVVDIETLDGISRISFHIFQENLSDFLFFREAELAVNNAFRIFGDDTEGKKRFNWDLELKEISNNNWNGRTWKITDSGTLIQINIGEKGLSLEIKYGQLNY
jgi:hypothetical protein